MINHEQLLDLCEQSKRTAVIAGKAILNVYHSNDFDISAKGDQSPLTTADKAAHEIISQELTRTELPLLSEEGRNIAFSERCEWEYFWMVDPLDGTKEFIKRNGEFTVNIALIHNQQPILGIIYVPVQNLLYWGGQGLGAFRQDADGIIHTLKTDSQSKDGNNLKIVASRSHLNDETQKFLAKLNTPEIVSMGSSLKFMILAEGEAHFYPRFAPTMEWDTAAAQAILEAAGGRVCIANSEHPLKYNKEDLLNPYFLASA